MGAAYREPDLPGQIRCDHVSRGIEVLQETVKVCFMDRIGHVKNITAANALMTSVAPRHGTQHGLQSQMLQHAHAGPARQ